jgi:hypothetical protein
MNTKKTQPQIFALPDSPASTPHGLTEEEARSIVERTTPRAGLVLPRPEPRPSDDVASSAPSPDDPSYLRALTAPDHPGSGEGDYRPGWVRAGMPREEWERARRANDAALRLAKPGSTDFSRLMEVRVRLHLPPPDGLSLADIDDYKAARLGPVVGRFGRWSKRQVALGAAILAMLGLVGYLAGLLLFDDAPTAGPVEPRAAEPVGAPGRDPSRNPAQALAPLGDPPPPPPIDAATSEAASASAETRTAPTEPTPSRTGSRERRPSQAVEASQPPAPGRRTPPEPAAGSEDGLYFRSPR